MRRIARPVARGRRLADEQPVRFFSRRRQDVDDLPRGVAAASIEAAVRRAYHAARTAVPSAIGIRRSRWCASPVSRTSCAAADTGRAGNRRTRRGGDRGWRGRLACRKTRPSMPARQGAPGRPRRRRCGCSRCRRPRSAAPRSRRLLPRGAPRVSASVVPDWPLAARLCRSVLLVTPFWSGGCVHAGCSSRSMQFPPVGRSSAPRSRRSPRPALPRHLPR